MISFKTICFFVRRVFFVFLVTIRDQNTLSPFRSTTAQAEPPPFTRVEERASHEGAEEEAEQLRLLDLDTHAL